MDTPVPYTLGHWGCRAMGRGGEGEGVGGWLPSFDESALLVCTHTHTHTHKLR